MPSLLGELNQSIVLLPDFQPYGRSPPQNSQSQAKKKLPETNAIFDKIKTKDSPSDSGRVKRLSLDSKATVKIGNYSRGGKTRGDNQADDHDLGCTEKYIPCGVVDEDSGQLYISFGSSFKTSDFIVDTLEQWWQLLKPQEQVPCELIQLKVDNGPYCSGIRTQFLKPMVELADTLSKPIQLLYYPPARGQVQSHRALLGSSGAALSMGPSSSMCQPC